MRLYYTGSIEPDTTQTSPTQSLGGYISSSLVETNSYGAVFASISQQEMLNGSSEIRMLALRNETDTTVNVKLYYENRDDSMAYYRMALVNPAFDEKCQRFFFERLESTGSLPVSASFRDNKNVDNALAFPLAPNAYIGIWIQRVLLKSRGEEFLSCENLATRFNSEDEPSKITWELTELVDGYFTVDDVAIVLGSPENPPSGYEVVYIPRTATDTLSDAIQNVNAKIDSILVSRGVLKREGNTLILNDIPKTPTSSGFSVTFDKGQSISTVEEMSIVIDY